MPNFKCSHGPLASVSYVPGLTKQAFFMPLLRQKNALRMYVASASIILPKNAYY